jgi:hypothetical protein
MMGCANTCWAQELKARESDPAIPKVEMPKTTPTPWWVGEPDRHEQRQIIGQNGRLVATCAHECVTALVPEMEANAELIVRAVNGLVAVEAALRETHELLTGRNFGGTSERRLARQKVEAAMQALGIEIQTDRTANL